MPKEDRRIIFSNDEVYKALYTLRDQKNLRRLPVGQIVTVANDQTEPTTIVFMVEDRIEQTVTKIDHNEDFVAAALMVFCRGCGIPLPKSAKKSVMIQDGIVILRVQIT